MALVAQYPLTDAPGSTVASETVAGRTGSFGGAPSSGPCGTAFHGGTDQFLSSSNSALAPTAVGSLTAWIRWPSALANSVRDWSGIPSGDNGWMLATLYSGSAPLPAVAYRVGGTEVLTGVTPAQVIGYDRHWALTWNAVESRLYLDGALVFVGPAPGATPIVLPWTMGRNGELSEWYASQGLDLRVYSHQLSAAEVLAVYGAGYPCNPVPPPGAGWSIAGVSVN